MCMWGSPFYPYQTANPASSNPYKIYSQLYEPFKEDDYYNKFIEQFRTDLEYGVRVKVLSNKTLRNSLIDICGKIELTFFYPMVYRVDIQQIPDKRKIVENSGRIGSNEYLIPDLQETEFDILFTEFEQEPNLDNDHLQLMSGSISSDAALAILEVRRR